MAGPVMSAIGINKVNIEKKRISKGIDLSNKKFLNVFKIKLLKSNNHRTWYIY